MRHYKRGRKLGTDASHTKAIKKSLVVNLFMNDRIKTTLERAKEIRGDVDRVVTWAKRGDVHSRRLAIAATGDQHLVGEIFSKVEQGMFEGREGGYTRILRLGKRRGDGATVVIMELVQEPVVKKQRADADKTEEAPRRGLLRGRRARGAEAEAGDETVEVEAGDEVEDEDEAEVEEAAAEVEDEVEDSVDEDEVEETEESDEAEVEEAEVEAETEDEAEEAEEAEEPEPEPEPEAEAELEPEPEAEAAEDDSPTDEAE